MENKETVCTRCNGTGKEWSSKYLVEYPCDACEATGRVTQQTSFTLSETERANAINAIHQPTIDLLKEVKPRGFEVAISTIREAIEYNLKKRKK